MLITHKGVEQISAAAFELARRRNGALPDAQRRVTLCDKANVLRSYAFFRKVFNEVVASYPDIETDYSYVDAMTVHLVERPDFYDVIVTENMFGDIISDLAAVTAGGMGMSPFRGDGRSTRFLPGVARIRPHDCRQGRRQSARHHPVGGADAALAGRAPRGSGSDRRRRGRRARGGRGSGFRRGTDPRSRRDRPHQRCRSADRRGVQA